MSSISINNCVFMGRLTDEPEMRYTRSNQPVTTFRIAVSRRASDTTDFIPCVVYGAQVSFPVVPERYAGYRNRTADLSYVGGQEHWQDPCRL